MKKLFLIPLMACMMCVSMVAQNVAKIGNTEYATLPEAFDAAMQSASSSVEIELLDSVTTLTSMIDINKTATKSVTLEMNGYTIRSTAQNTFSLYKGSLTVKNKVPGQGAIYNMSTSGSNTQIFVVYGSVSKAYNPRKDGEFYSYLLIDEGVNLVSLKGPKGVGVTVEQGSNFIYSASRGVANGVRIDIKGHIEGRRYCVKVNGQIDYPKEVYRDYFNANKSKFYGDEDVQMLESDTAFCPYIHIFPSAVLNGVNEPSSVAVYGGGYGRWLIEGTCAAASGVYLKSGTVILRDANVSSTYEGKASTTTGLGSGVQSQGNAIVIESNAAYAGMHELTVEGDTKAETKADDGTALAELVSDNTAETKVENISINGGNFTGENAIVISTKTAADDNASITVHGITLVGEVAVGNDEGATAISNIINSDAVHTTTVVNEDGTKTTVISEGAAPTEYADFDDAVAAAAADPTKNIKWTGITTKIIGDGETNVSKTLPELQMISGSKGESGQPDNLQKIIVKNKAELHIKHLIMNDFARIEVEAGGKLIVEGEQGMNAPSKENILIETSEANPAYFMFNPAVTSNKHPLAKVQMWSKGYQRNPGDFVWQRFGMPGWSTDVRLLDVAFDAPTYAFSVNTDKTPINDWSIMGWYDTFKPFGSYILSTTNGAPGDIYTFACPMVGNENAVLGLYSHYNYFANSYTAPIDIWTLISDFEEKYPNVDATIYLYDPQTDYWSDINFATLLTEDDCPTTIEPMFAFILVATPSVSPVIDYKAAIWDPIMNPSPAPARRQGAQFNTARIDIVAEDGTADHVNLVEGNQFTAAYDNAYDAEKLTIGERTFLYANGCRDKMGVVATDNLEGTLLSMNTTDQTSFTMQFSNVNGLNYAVRDMLTGTETEIVEGATYMFSVPADATVEGRFKIVAVNKVPTAIENTEVENTEKGIYNMAGQYVGTDFHILPAGVYVVDGKKIVK